MSFSSSDDDSQERFALGFLFALIALVVSTVVGVVVYKRGIAHAPAPVAVTAPAPAAVVVTEDVASVRVEDGVVKFYFASGKAELAAGALGALGDAIAAAQGGKRLVISGFHDATGDAAFNAELAKQRAFGVRDALMGAGVAETSIELKKPEETTGSGNNAEARRVEVMIAQ
jgi:outer membrane protein OmpA-like peptidoglycan-associated protein